MAHLPRIALTPGEPAGIGPDLCIRLARRSFPAQLVLIANPELLIQRARALGEAIRWTPFDPQAPRTPQTAGSLLIHPQALQRPAQPGRLDPANSAYVLKTLEIACDGCLDGTFDALVTGPVHKGVINAAGFPFTGHTEFLARRCGVEQPLMLLAIPGLRVALATTHLPLRQVADAITREHLARCLRILHADLRKKFRCPAPRILVCGLNPHAGEGGHLGREEIEVIEPVLRTLRQAGLDLVGPVPGDTAFVPDRLAGVDAVLALYHDQGLAVLKAQGFGRAVNITLGLPILRTSVDHGTALSLAGTGRGDLGSLEAALAMALALCERA